MMKQLLRSNMSLADFCFASACTGHSKARRSLGVGKSAVTCKVSAWRNPKDRPNRAGSVQTPDKLELSRTRYEGPDQDLAAQLER